MSHINSMYCPCDVITCCSKANGFVTCRQSFIYKKKVKGKKMKKILNQNDTNYIGTLKL